jgi:sialate O-acetylesterase
MRNKINAFLFLELILFCLSTLFAQQKAGSNICPIDADIWVLAGQSNMAGGGRTPDTMTYPKIMMLNMDDHWMPAQNPLHRVYEASAFAYEKDMYDLLPASQKNWTKFKEQYEKTREQSKKEPIGSVGPGIYFAQKVFRSTNHAIGLIPCAIGGSTISQWNPGKKYLGDSSLYGATINKINAVGGKIKGIIWYQGESEAMLQDTKTYETKFLDIIDSFRKDLNNPNLPILYVQIGKFNNKDAAMDKAWENIREIQRDVLKKRSNVFMVTGIDLPLDDCVHLSTDGQKRLGNRLAEMALTYVYKRPGHANLINLESTKLCKETISGSYYIHLHYSGVCGKLKSGGLPSQYSLRLNGKENIMYVVSKIQLDPKDNAGIDVYLSGLPDIPVQLVSGAGTYPYMNITDSFDNALPAFGPIDLSLK